MAKRAIVVDQATIPSVGIQAIVRFGECFGESIEWDAPELATIRVGEQVNMVGEPGLLIGDGWGYAGLQKGKNIYWRYTNEAEYGSGEHCLKIIALL